MMKKKLIGSVLSAGLLLGSSADKPKQPEAPLLEFQEPTPVSAVQLNELNSDMGVLRHYWSGKIATTKTVQLKIVEGTQHFECLVPHWEVLSNTNSVASYCLTPSEIVLPQTGVNRLHEIARMKDVPFRSLVLLTLAHEWGHAYQAGKSANFYELFARDPKRYELQADCFAGQAIAAVDKTVLPDEAPFIDALSIGIDPAHGTPQQRIATFQHGSHGETC